MATAPPTASVTWCDPIRRHVVPYPHAFETNVKGRWVDKTAVDVFATEFAYYPKDFYTAQARRGALQVRRRGQWLTPEEVLVTRLKTGDTVKHTIHRHELPIVNSGPIELLRFVPAASLGVFAARAADGLLCLSKPPTVPVHPCGRYHRHSVTRLLAEGHVARYRLPTAPPPGFEDFAAPEDLISPYLGGDDEITDMLLQEIVRQVRLGDGAHTVHRLDKATTGLLLVATSKQVSAAVFDALSEKSEEMFEHSAASLRNETSAPRDADAALGSKRQRPDSDVGGAPTPSAAERTGKIYLARVSGRFPGGGAPIMVQRGIYCASHKAGRFAALSEAEERSRRELAKRRADAAREAGMAPGTSEQEVNVALARKAVLDGGGDDAVAAKREAQRQATQSKSNGDDSEDPADAKWAETTFRLLRYDEATDESVVECRPVTGRTHQLRVHLGLVLGHPIVLDKTYGWHARGEEESTEAAVKRLFALPYMRAQSSTPEVRDVMEGCPECECAADREQLRDATAEANDDDGSSSNDFWEGFICLHASEYRLVLRGVKNALILSAPPPPWL